MRKMIVRAIVLVLLVLLALAATIGTSSVNMYPFVIASAMPMGIVGVSLKSRKSIENVVIAKEIDDLPWIVCKTFKEIVDALDYDRRKEILRVLINSNEALTFKQIQEVTGIPASSLHNHLSKLYDFGFIKKTEEFPVKYAITEFTKYLMLLHSQLQRSIYANKPLLAVSHAMIAESPMVISAKV